MIKTFNPDNITFIHEYLRVIFCPFCEGTVTTELISNDLHCPYCDEILLSL